MSTQAFTMCGTTWLQHSQCQHSERVILENSKCAIGYADPGSRFHWQEAQGIEHVDDLCHTCQYRLDKYSTTDPNVSWSQLVFAVSKGNWTQSEGSTSDDESVESL